MMDFFTQHHFSAGVYAKQMRLNAGCMALSHKHAYDHLSILASGIAIVRTSEGEKRFIAPACIEIKAGLNHEIVALEDVVWFCIHATEETDASKVDDVLIAKE